MAVRILEINDLERRVTDLCEIMSTETEVCRELLELSRAEQEYLIKNDVDSLTENTDKMKMAVDVLKKSQSNRHACMGEIASDLDVDRDDMTIRSIRAKIDTELSEKLRKTSRELMKVGERLYRTNHNTVYLIDFSLDLLDQQNRLWAELVSEKEEGYTDGRKRNHAQTVPLLVERKV